MNDLKQTQLTRWLPVTVFALFGIYLLFQYSHVYLYFDDFGYLSLSYGYHTAGVTGHTYTFGQMMEFLLMHYLEANGRLLYTGLFLFLYLLGGLRLLQVSMAAIVLAIMILIYFKVNRDSFNWVQKTVLAAVVCLLFGTISLHINRQGTYWFAASFAYITPCIPFLLLSEFYLKEKERPSAGKTLFLCFLAFLSSFSQEQWWVATCVLTGSIAVYRLSLHPGHRLRLPDLLILICAVSGGLIIVLSPSVALRLTRDNANIAFADLSFSEKIITNIKGILSLFTTETNQPYLTVLLAALFLMALFVLTKQKRLWQLHTGYLLCCLFFFMSPHVIEAHRFVLWSSFLIFTVLEVAVFYCLTENIGHLTVFAAAIASLSCMVVVPELPTRILLPYLLLSFLLIGDIAGCVLRESNPLLAAVCLLFLARPSFQNLEAASIGYAENYQILTENESRLMTASSNPDGQQTDIVLKKQKVYDFGGDMMYQEPFGFMEYWLREYFDLPEGMTIRYED